MTTVGIVGLDTSHSEAFASVLDERDDADVRAVWDSGTIRSREYVTEFCERYDAREVQTPEEMIGLVDGVMILTVDWDAHCELALPFLEAGIPTLVDKPIAGRLRDIDILQAAANGTPFFGGSAVPYHREVAGLPVDGSDLSLYCSGYDNPFYYGCHLVDAVRRLAGTDWTVVAPASNPGLAVEVLFENDAFATLHLDGSEEEGAFAFFSIGDRTEAALVGDGDADRQAMYENYVDAYLETVTGSIDESRRVFDAARLLLAVHAALSERQPITATGNKLENVHVQGDSFVESYEPYY